MDILVNKVKIVLILLIATISSVSAQVKVSSRFSLDTSKFQVQTKYDIYISNQTLSNYSYISMSPDSVITIKGDTCALIKVVFKSFSKQNEQYCQLYDKYLAASDLLRYIPTLVYRGCSYSKYKRLLYHYWKLNNQSKRKLKSLKKKRNIKQSLFI